MTTRKTPLDAGKNVLQLGAIVVRALRDGAPEALELLEQYTESFEAWQKSWKRAATAPHTVKFSAKEREIGERIAAQHATVMELTEEMLRSLEGSLKDLRGWNKGIRAYIDHLPSKISTIRTRKG
jgi:hypothetical protein